MDAPKSKDLETSLVETLRSSDLSDMGEDIAELVLDSFLNGGIAESIPVIKWVVGIGKTVNNVKDFFLIKKILKFFSGLSEISDEEREQFISKLEEGGKFENHVSETIMMLLDRYDHISKASFLSKLFCAYGRGEMDYDTFLRLSTAIDRAFIKDIIDLINYYSGRDDIDQDRVKRNLYPSGFTDFYVLSDEQRFKAGLERAQVYHFNQQAQTFAQAILKEKYRQR